MNIAQSIYEVRPQFSEILKKDINFVRVPRNSFLKLENLNLQNLSIEKTAIEVWNYEDRLNQIFQDKIEAAKDSETKKAINLLKEDILNTLKSCYKISDKYYPHEISLNLIQGIPCTKLHADFLPLRLICTYLGPGTIFLPKESTRYPCLNEGRPNKRVLIKGKPTFQAKPFEILILKGRKFNKGELRPCAHRSPEVIKGEKRLVLKVDFK